MMYFGRGFFPSTSFVSLLLLLSIAAPNYVKAEWCKSIQYNPDVFDETPIQSSFEDRDCGNDDCEAYVCKVKNTFYFGQGCKVDMINFCELEDDLGNPILGQFIGRSLNPTPFRLYKKYMEEVKPFGDDSFQEHFFWMEVGYELHDDIKLMFMGYWAKKANAYFSINLQNFINEIQNSEINVKEKIEEKAKVLQMETESLFRDIQDVQNAANQSLPQNEYFQKKYAEMKPKMDAIKENDIIFRTYLIKSNETVSNVETDMNNAERKNRASMFALGHDSKFEEYQSIQDKILQNVSSNKEKVMDLLKFANETVENITFVADDETALFQSVAYEARKAIKDFENEKEMRDLMKEVKAAVEDVKKIGQAAQKTANKAQEIANDSNMTATNAGKTAQNAKAVADESKLTAENAKNIAENTKKVADSAEKDAEAPKKLLAEALHSNGRKSGGFGVAMIISFLVLLI